MPPLNDISSRGDIGAPYQRVRRNRSSSLSHARSKSLNSAVLHRVPRFSDDGSVSFASLWNYHSITVLALLVAYLIGVAFFEPQSSDGVNTSYNIRRGILACCLSYICYGLTQSNDGPFIRPHPAFWRLLLSVSVLYEMALIFLLMQSEDDARKLVWNLDSSLGSPLVEQSYGGECTLWDFDNPSDPLHNFWDKWDVFIVAHIASWWAKMMIVRSVGFCLVMSFLFECLEYTFEHQLANFSECWWDHWVLDFIVFNGIGILLGCITLKYLNAKDYHWQSVWTYPTFQGKISRMFLQFTPYYWTEFQWNPLLSFQRYLSLVGVMFSVLVADINSFYLKYIFWLEPAHWINIARLILLGLCASVGLCEFYKYTTDMTCTKIGQQAWVILGISITELLIVIKFAKETILVPFPDHVKIGWALLGTAWTIHAIFVFLIPAWKRWKAKDISRRGSDTKEA